MIRMTSDGGLQGQVLRYKIHSFSNSGHFHAHQAVVFEDGVDFLRYETETVPRTS